VFVDGDVSLERYTDEATGKTFNNVRIIQTRAHVLRSPRPAVEEADAEAEV